VNSHAWQQRLKEAGIVLDHAPDLAGVLRMSNPYQVHAALHVDLTVL